MSATVDERDRVATTLAWLLTCVYVLSSVAAMWLLSPRVPYADAWRYLARFLSLPFPQSVLVPENGHPAFLAHMARVLDLHVAAGNQALVTAIGIALVLATLGVAWRIARTVDAPGPRAAAMLSIVLGLFWLGNARTLMHGAEAVHAYAVTLFLCVGLWLLTRDERHAGARRETLAALAAVACGLAATFSFGSGIACFAGFGVIMLLRRSAAGFATLVAGWLVVFALVQAAGGAGIAPAFEPLRQVDLVLRWLGGPLAYAVWPAQDADAAQLLPVARVVLVPVARAAEAAFGPLAMAPRWPHAGVGLLGLAWLVLLALRSWQRRPGAGSPAALAGVGIAVFALATGLLLAAMRLDYFVTHPGQVLAPRYLVWSSLFWAGLLLATVAQLGNRRRAAWVAIVAALLLLPGHVLRGVHGTSLKSAADRVALAAAVGVIEPDLFLGENITGELARALPLSRAAGATVHAWPETRALGRRVPGAAPGGGATVAGMEVVVVDNVVGDPGRRVRFTPGSMGCPRVLLVDADGVARGLARRDRFGDGTWIGWMQGTIGGMPRALDCAATSAAAAAVPPQGAVDGIGVLPNPPSASAAR